MQPDAEADRGAEVVEIEMARRRGNLPGVSEDRQVHELRRAPSILGVEQQEMTVTKAERREAPDRVPAADVGKVEVWDLLPICDRRHGDQASQRDDPVTVQEGKELRRLDVDPGEARVAPVDVRVAVGPEPGATATPRIAG